MSCNNNILSINSSQGPQGPQGIQGIQGPPGETLTALGTEATYADMILAYPTPSLLDAYIVQDTSIFWVYDPASSAANGDGWVDMGSLQGPQGIQGIQGLSGTGAAGTSSYTYVAYADNVISNVTTNFSYPNPLSTTEWIAIIVSPTVIVTPVAANFNNKWIKIKSNSGSTTPSSVFTSGSINPVAPGTDGDVFFNTTTFQVLTYDGNTSAWIVVPFAYNISAWQTTTGTAGWTSSVQYRQQGGMVIFKEYILGTTSYPVYTDILLFTLPVGYRPLITKNLPILDYTTGIWGIVEINSTGTVTLLGTITPVMSDRLIFDSVTFPLS